VVTFHPNRNDTRDEKCKLEKRLIGMFWHETEGAVRGR